MDISELTAYAEEKYHISEQFRRRQFSGGGELRITELCNPYTGKPAAVLLRQWDEDDGEEVQLCDLKCGHASLRRFSEPWLTAPFRMQGADWVGIRFDDRTDPETVFRLFDDAMKAGQARGYTITLGSMHPAQETKYRDTPLPPPAARKPKATPQAPEPEQLTLQGLIDKAMAAAEALAHTFTLGLEARETEYRDTPLTGARREASQAPEKLREMRRLYDHKDHSFRGTCKNFYVQGKFMEDYEDDAPWNGELRLYFPTYHDLRLEQLRGYFTWRTALRRGEFRPICTSLAYLYIYELLNDIGAEDAADSLRKLREFEAGFLDSGIGDGSIRRNLRRWMLEKAVVSGLPPEAVREYADPETLRRDAALAALRDPKTRTDEEIFDALVVLGGSRLSNSPAARSEEGRSLFARVWRLAAAQYREEGKSLFTRCFGGCRSHRWDPLANAVYYQREKPAAETLWLNEVRSYTCNGGTWSEKCYQERSFDKKLLEGLLHEMERQLRLYLDLGRRLQEKPEEAWAAPYVEAVIEEDRQAKAEAAKKKVTIDLSGLEQIRRDSLVTRDSLLTEEDLREAEEASQAAPAPEEREAEIPALPLDPEQRQLLILILQGKPAAPWLAEKRRMPTVEVDAVNEALFDEIGDSVLEWDGNEITLVEDYREDVLRLLGGKTE
jgi:hypothetical protein